MPLPSLHPLPNNPTTGQAPLASFGSSRSGPPPASAAGGGGVSRETLKGLQDVYWSDDEDDPDCLLCAEPLDLSDLNFKPCQCGMQICQFCYNKLLTTDSRCPGCRRPYDTKAVVFQPVDWEEAKRVKEKKAKRAKTIKQLTSLGRRHLLDIRVVMKNMVYVIGMKIPGTGDEAISILRSNDYFGQYGKISKLYLRDRPADLDSDTPSTGIYIVYVRREDAARAILALDGIPAPQGPAGQVLRANYGTTRYCDAFLRAQKCDNSGCTNLHEWGGDNDCFTKDDYEIALTRPAEYDARQKQAQIVAPPLSKPSDWPKPSSVQDIGGSSSLPSSAAWGKGVPVARSNSRGGAAPIGTSRPVKAPTSVQLPPPLKSNAAFPLPTPSPVQPPPIKEKKEKKEKPTHMARGKSTDSSLSATTNSAQVSPKKKHSALAPVTAIKAVPPPPPGLTIVSGGASASKTSQEVETPIEEDVPEEVHSEESEAGPSSATPPPQTPSKYSSQPPPPLTDEPIRIHSPYEEPFYWTFPSTDPDFVFSTDLGANLESGLPEFNYKPAPFNKTLLGLAELGLLPADLPDMFDSARHEGYSSSFQPFEPIDFDEAGPSRIQSDETIETEEEEEDWEHDAPRTTSRFDFARPSSRSTSIGRGTSPFTMTSSITEERGWKAGPPPASGQPIPNHFAPLSRGQLGSGEQAGHSGLMGYHTGSSGNEWAGTGEDSPYTNRAERYKRDREDHSSMPNWEQAVASRLFSPERSTHSRLDDFHGSSHHNPNSHPQSHPHQSPFHGSASTTAGGSANGPTAPPPGFLHASPHYDVRNMGYAQQRPQSPSPMPQGYRRY